MTDFQRRPVEPGPQPDPMLETGRRGTGWLFLVALAMVAVVFGTLYGINKQEEPQTATSEPAAPETTGQNAAPQSPVSGGRGTANAPAEKQAKGQTGQGNGAEQNPAAGTQGSKSTTTGQGGQAQDNQGQQAPKQQ